MFPNILTASRHLPQAGVAVLLFGSALLPRSIPAQQITVGANVHVSKDRPRIHHRELWAGADLTDPDRLIACAMSEVVPSDNTTKTRYYVSHDRGKTWKHTLAVREVGYSFSADNVCEFGPGGVAYAISLSVESGVQDDRTVVHRSPDGGLTWDPKPARFAFIDREAFAADNTRGKFHGRLYVHGQGRIPTLTDEGFQTAIKLYRSLDGGRTFIGPAFRFVPRPSTISGCGNSGLLSDGTLVATVCVHERGPISGTWQSRIVVIRSTDGGETLEREIKVADIHESAMPSLAIDGGSAAFNDRVYVTWADSSNGRHRIFVSVSADQGKSWSAPRAVDDTQPRTDGAAGLDVILPVVKVNRDGVVGVSWYDKRAVPGNLGWDLRFAASLDGGETFTPSVRVSEQSSVLTGNKAEVWPVGTARVAASPEGIAVEYGLLSLAAPYEDTNGMAVAADGTFHPVWVDNRTGMSQVWTAAVRVHGIAARHGTPELANLVDVSNKVAIALSRVAFDRPTGSLTAVYRVRNTSRERVLGPVKLRLVALAGDMGPVSTRDADNGVEGVGAVWDMTPLIGDGTLDPDEESRGRTLKFTVIAPRRFGPRGEERFVIAQPVFRVLAGGPGTLAPTIP